MTDNIIARQIMVTGQVQGVGFRPFIYRLAHQHQLNGSVCNHMGQVEIIVQGGAHHVDQFSIALIERSPKIAEPYIVSDEKVAVVDRLQFEILPSETGGEASIHGPADFFTCSDCLAELYDLIFLPVQIVWRSYTIRKTGAILIRLLIAPSAGRAIP
jgi:hydrogenase maturation protein HypF